MFLKINFKDDILFTTYLKPKTSKLLVNSSKNKKYFIPHADIYEVIKNVTIAAVYISIMRACTIANNFRGRGAKTLHKKTEHKQELTLNELAITGLVTDQVR
jgi:hypothetical protein